MQTTAARAARRTVKRRRFAVPSWRGISRVAARSRIAVAGFCICLPIVLLAVIAPAVAPYDPQGMNIQQRLLAPSLSHPMGTDVFGRDTLSRVIFGDRISVEVGGLSVLLGLVVGSALGATAGYTGGRFDDVVMRLMDATLAFPAILLALVLIAILGPGLVAVMTAVAALRIPIFARTIRSLVLTERTRDYVDAARCIGQRHVVILLRHIFPNILSATIVLATSYFASGIVIEASLSFLGLGVIPPDVSWGTMLNDSRQVMQMDPWTAVFPGLALSVAVLGFNLLGDGVRDLLDPWLTTAAAGRRAPRGIAAGTPASS
jgi:ABC-type dipeptide/oligopeptide/nickel transport system permease subunit